MTLSSLGVGTTRLKLLAALRFPESLFFLLPPSSEQFHLMFSWHHSLVSTLADTCVSQFLQNPQLVSERWAVSFVDSESQVMGIFMRAILITLTLSK